jgi:NAD(P)-dependent dehydrogenase (short-subunit alcohol dehydrogenase family)
MSMGYAPNHPFLGPKYESFKQAFDLSGRVALVTGAGGLLGPRHAEALLEVGAVVVLNEISKPKLHAAVKALRKRFPKREVGGVVADITKPYQVEAMVADIVKKHGGLDILVNNAANNPKMSGGEDVAKTRLEEFPLDAWSGDLAVGLTGAFLCCKAASRVMIAQRRGVIVNISSDMGIISPDQRVYLKPGQKNGEQPFKPVTYAVVKGGLVAMTRWLATYLAPYDVRVNTLTPASVFAAQPEHLVNNLADRIPLARMSHPDEFKGALQFLCADASSYMTGQNLILDGGRSIW